LKISLLSSALALTIGALALSPTANAAGPTTFAGGTITFNGQITGQTCDIDGNGTGGKDFTVTLPTVSKQSLPAAGAVAGATPFHISLSNCSPATGNVSTYFEPSGAAVDMATGNLNIDAGGATNVQLQLLNSDNTAITIGATTGANGADNSGSKRVALVAGAAQLNYFVQYFAIRGAAGEGSVTSRVQYTIKYN
jgi:major type 1 subunit fimbrin (pilin)